MNYLFTPDARPIVTAWQSYTPTGSWNTNVTYTGFYRRVGDSIEGLVRVTCSGAPNNTGLTIVVLGALGLTFDSAKLTAQSGGFAPILGEVLCVDAGAALYSGFAVYSSSDTLQLYIGGASGSTVNGVNFSTTVPITFASGDFVEVKFRAPITGWS
jgi:hypothetical protein